MTISCLFTNLILILVMMMHEFTIPSFLNIVNYLLSFPSGLEYNEDGTKIMILYGDHDAQCKVLIFDVDVFDDMLIHPVLDGTKIDGCTLWPGPKFDILEKHVPKRTRYALE